VLTIGLVMSEWGDSKGWPGFQFWTTLIEVTEKPTGKALESLEINCTHVTGNYWIMEGEVDCLRDDGVRLKEIAEGAVGSLGELSEKELKEVCLQAYGVRL